MANLPFHLFDVKHNTDPKNKIQIYVPKELYKNVDNMIQSVLMVNNNLTDDSRKKIVDIEKYCYKLNPMEPGTEFILNIKQKKFKIEIIKCYHIIDCVGYGIIEIKSKLKKEYSGLTNKEIVDLKKQKIEICDEIENPVFCFLGDTSKEILDDKTIEKYKNIMIECTFLVEEDIEQANKTTHMHWNYLEPYIKNHPDNTFILYHFSRRYKKKFIEEFFKDTYKNIIPWIN